MRRRRRRFFRDEALAPWITVMVIVGLWWAGARFFSDASSPLGPGAQGEQAPQGAQAATRTQGPQGASGAPGARAAPGAPCAPGTPCAPGDAVRVSDDAARRPLVPVAGVEASSLRSTFDETRGGGSRRHEALDILAPRGTAVVAAVDGRVAKLFTSAAGGLTIYQFDTDEQFCYYYAHLDGYAPNLNEGQIVRRGEVIGYVGTTGNAPPGTPHLHFAIYRLGPEKNWWEGEPIDPIDVLR